MEYLVFVIMFLPEHKVPDQIIRLPVVAGQCEKMKNQIDIHGSEYIVHGSIMTPGTYRISVHCENGGTT